jgi:SAM-dependent methyltransferase
VRDAMRRTSGALQRWITPGVRYHQDVFVDMLDHYAPRGGAWLELGCGHQLLPPWHAHREREMLGRAARVVGLDYDIDSLRRHETIRERLRADIGALPFPAETFDLVTANMVVEHVERPDLLFAEVARVLRPRGVFLFHTPNARNYQVRIAGMVPEGLKPVLAGLVEGRKSEDVFPTFYRANDDTSVRRFAAGAGLEIDRLDHISTYPGLGLVPPLALVELLWIRLLERPSLTPYRHNLVCALRKPARA